MIKIFFLLLFVCLIVIFIGKKVQSLLRGRVSQDIPREDLTGQVFCITGGNRGIGLETVKILLDWGGTVILGVRDVQSCEKNLDEILPKHVRNRVIVGELNLHSFASVNEFVKKYFIERNQSLDCLINNAHHSGLSKVNCTHDRLEYSYQVNYLSHCLLTLLLIPLMTKNSNNNDNNNSNKNTKSKIPRIVQVGSRTHIYGSIRKDIYSEKGRGIDLYDPNRIYPDTKLMQLLFNKTLTSQLQRLGVNVSSNYVHPGGLVDTCDSWIRGSEYSLPLRIEPLLAKIVGTNVKDAAKAVIKVATLKPKVLKVNNKLIIEGNKYFDTTYEIDNKSNLQTEEIELWLWENTFQLIGLPIDYLEKNACRKDQ